MTLYLLKFVLCSVVLFALFRLFLAKEKCFQFNRIALLLILPLSALAPLLSIPIQIVPTAQPLFLEQQLSPISPIEILAPTTATREPSTIDWIFLAYLCIAGGLFLSKLLSIWTLLKWRNQGEQLRLEDTTIVISEKAQTPFSFMNSIFLSRKDYEKGNDLGVILSHEMAHISQKHYLDLLFLELLNVIFWFNPICYFIKYQAQINHEFLADQAILEKDYDINQYKKKLFQFSTSNLVPLTSPIVSSTLKLRIAMLNKIQNNRTKKLSLIASCILGILTCGAFAIDLQAQEVKAIPVKNVSQESQSSEQLSKAAQELDVILDSNIVTTTNSKGEKMNRFSMEKLDKVQIYHLYKDLPESEKTGRRKAIGDMITRMTLMPDRKTITKEDLEKWQNPNEYGVWIDGGRVDNAVLSTANPGDYASYFVSKLEKNAKNYGKHTYQLNLMTNAYFEKTYPLLKIEE